MATDRARRTFLQTGATAGALVGLGDLAFLANLRPVSAEETKLDPNVVQLRPEISPLVRLIEETPRERLLEEVAARIDNGLGYRDLLAALLLAGVKNVEPRPSVGFKFHAVLVVNSAHLASISGPPEHRWLPIFWALDYYQSAAARDWTMSAIDDTKLPPAHKARGAFASAMDNWDEAAADSAVAALARTAGANEIYEMLWRYGARDFRSIGHKAIFVANSWRTLACIGWQHSEPVLRSLAYALQMHEGSNPAKRDDEADRPFRRNRELAAEIHNEWRGGQLDESATTELIQTLRTGSRDEACDLLVEQLNRGVSPQSVWDGLHTTAGELLLKQPGIVALHAVTTTNALRFAFDTSSNDETRRLMMLQNAAFLPMFRSGMKRRGRISDVTIDDLRSAEGKSGGDDALMQVFADLRRDPRSAAAQSLAYLDRTGDAKELIDTARLLVFAKGDDAHDYKFSSAVLEDYYKVSPGWRGVFMAANMPKLHGTEERDNPLVERTRAALKA